MWAMDARLNCRRDIVVYIGPRKHFGRGVMEGTASRFAATLFLGLATYLAVPTPAPAVTLRLSPNGVDDTPQLQAALESCAGAVTSCVIRLARGTFRTDLLLVADFRGEIRGEGAGMTIVQPLLGRYLRPSLSPFDAPPTLDARYPALLHFTDGGNITLADLTFDFPSRMRVLPWYQKFWNTLLSAILVDGGAAQRARLRMMGVEILARPCRKIVTLHSNVMAAVLFGGKEAWFPLPTALHTERLGGGTFLASNNLIQDSGIGFAVHDATHIQVRIADNDIEHTRRNAVSLFDLGGSWIRIVDNRIAAEGTIINNYRGLEDFNAVRPPPSNEPSDFRIARNSITLTGLSDFGADPINTTDWLGTSPAENPNAGIDTWAIVDNDIVLDVTGRAAGITVWGDRGHALVAHNRIWGNAAVTGPGAIAIGIEHGVGTRVNRNTFFAFPSDRPTVALGSFTRECRVIQPASIVVDDGTNNDVVATEVR
jgi:hypothetical protein